MEDADVDIWYEFTPEETGRYAFVNTSMEGSLLLGESKEEYSNIQLSTLPTYNMEAGKTYYVKTESTAGEHNITINKIKESLSLGTNTIGVSSSENIWYEFTPEEDGMYEFDAMLIDGDMYVNEDKSSQGKASLADIPIYNLSKDVTYYVNVQSSAGVHDFIVRKLNTSLAEGWNSIRISDPYIWYTFVPEKSGTYRFSNLAEDERLVLNRDRGEEGESQTNEPVYGLAAGTTYYVNINYSSGEYDLTITKLDSTLELGDNSVYAGDEDGWYEFTPNQSGTYMFSSSITEGYIIVNTDKSDEGEELITSSPIYSLTKDTTYKVRIAYSPGEVDLNIQQIQWTAEVSVVVGGENADEIAEYFQGTGTYNHGDSIRFIALDAPCNEFLGWYDAKDLDDNNQFADAEPLSTDYVFVTLADKDYSVVAVYEETVHSGVTTVKNHKKATPEKSGYTGDLVCECGEVLEKGTVINRPKYLKGISSGYIYTGSPITPAVTVKDWKGNIISDSHYKVEYQNNTLPGVAKVVVTFDSEDYTGTMEQEFNITVPKTSITSVKNGSAGKITTVWKTRAAVDGYYVMVKDEQGKLVKSGKYAGSDVRTATFSGLEKGKTYRVYVRTYVKTDDQTYYSEWSPVEKITLEK